jgi:hypothetical protein
MSNSEPFSQYPSTHREVDLVISELLTDPTTLNPADKCVLRALTVAERAACAKHQKRSMLNISNTVR